MKNSRPPIDGALAVETTTANKVRYCSVTYVSMSTCEGNGCPFLDEGCMAQLGNMRLHSTRSFHLNAQNAIYNESLHILWLSARVPLRLRESGDQPDEEGLIKHTAPACATYTSRRRQPVWTYSHNWRKLSRDAWGVISVLASVHSIKEMRTARTKGYASAIVLPEAPAKVWHDGQDTMVHCPNEWKDMLCIDCKLCMKAKHLFDHRISIVFTPHGNRKNHILRRYASGAVTSAALPSTPTNRTA